MGKAYTEEMQQLPATIEWAAGQPVDLLRRAVQLYSDRGLLAVGSGGSFTGAALAAELHLRAYGQPSQAITPLDVFQLPAAASTYAAGMILSAEGKNHDVLAAAKQLLVGGFPAIGLTLRSDSPLVQFSDATGAACLACFDMPWGKDGYLATNSLMATLILLWRAYADAVVVSAQLPKLVDWHRAFRQRLFAEVGGFPRGSRVLILHGIAGRIGAIDLESKLSEGALAFGQVCNFRQFAHGRHLQFDASKEPFAIVSFHASNDPLAHATHQLLPTWPASRLDVALPALAYPGTEIAAVLAAFAIVEAWAGEESDPGRPEVPQFGRDLHSLDVADLVREPVLPFPAVARKQLQGREARTLVARGLAYLDRLRSARLRALVCDFDGTFCDTAKRFDGLDANLVPEITRLARAGIHLAFATGRGAKLASELRSKLPQDVWRKITLGCYSGSYFIELDRDRLDAPVADPRLVQLAQWLCDRQVLPEHITPRVDAGQLGLRGLPGAERWRLIAAINEWVAAEAHRGWRTFSSGHSVDVITEHVGKRRVVEHLCERLQLDPLTQVLRLGDAGDFGGNDYELLSEGVALSVDAVPPDASQCWNLLPRMLRGVRGTQFYLQSLEAEASVARFSVAFLQRSAAALRERVSDSREPQGS